jgi:2',3'-cyclic-nucleotide 2'-phosphodiesterase (5'-nucleotidase family)/predicted extracellular nuclease
LGKMKRKTFSLLTAFVFLLSYVFSGQAFAEDILTVQQAIENNNGTGTVEGYIVAHTLATNSYDYEAPFGNDYNFALADTPDERDPSKILPVQISSSFRSSFGLQTNSDLVGKKVRVTGTLTPYFNVPGLKEPTAIVFADGSGGDPGEPEPPAITGLKIHEIQGEDHVSPYKDKDVAGVKGIVTKVEGSNAFFMQEPEEDGNPNTSEAIYVYKKAHGLTAGDQVEVDGLVKEWVLDGYSEKLQTDLAMTEINATEVRKLASGMVLPNPVIIGKDRIAPTQVIDNDKFSVFDPAEDGIDFYESLEGMRVGVESPQVIGPQKYGEVPVIASKAEGKTYSPQGGILLTKDSGNPERMFLLINRDFVAKAGDRFNGTVTGVVSYSFSNFKILVDQETLPELNESELVEDYTTLEEIEDKLTVASYNIENFSAATAAEKTSRIAQSIINNMKTPDVIGLVEVQDNDGQTASGSSDASQSYETLINEIAAQGGPTYSWTDISPEYNQDGGAPGGNIRVGYLYNPDRVQLKHAPKGTATDAVAYENGNLTLNPGRIDPQNPIFEDTRKPLAAEFEFKGQDVVVIANHFNSKGGDNPLFGKIQPPVLGSEAKRIEIAKLLNEFVAGIHEQDPKANVVVLGDLNDFEYSMPIETLENGQLTNMIETLPEGQRFTYNYQGNSQVLDHILVSNHLADRAEADIVNINSLYMEEHGRASDHDPVMVQLDLKPGPFELSLMHTNDTHAHLENIPRLFTAVDVIRSESVNNLLLNAGDVFSGTLFFNKYLGQADLEFMNQLGYDAMTFGNHEFDKESSVLADFVENANFPFVSSNIQFENDADLGPLFKDQIANPGEPANIYPAIVKNIAGEQVGIFGLTTEDTAFLANPGENIVFEDAIQKSAETVKMLQDAGVNKIIALSHLGYNADQKLAEDIAGIDVIIGGHTHTKLDSPIIKNETSEPTLIVQASEYGRYLGHLNVAFDEKGILTEWDGKLLNLLQKDEAGQFVYSENEWAKQRLAELSAPIEELKNQIVGYANVALDGERSNVRTQETNLGNLIADSMLAKAQESVNAQIAMQNGGGIRASIDAGEISLGEVLTVMPFGNTLVTLDLTGEEIWQALEHSVSNVENEAGQFMQVAGLRFKYDPSLPAGERVYRVEVNGENGYEKIELSTTYTVATNAFVADGGDGYEVFKQAKTDGRMTELFEVDYDVFTSYLEKNSPVSPSVEGRILEGIKAEEPGEEEKGCPQPGVNYGKHKGHAKEMNDNGKHLGHDKKGKACGYNKAG